MDFEELGNTIRTKIADFTDGLTDVEKIIHDNEQASPPNPNDHIVWMRCNVLTGNSYQASLGAKKRWRTPGVIVFQIFVAIGSGTAVIDRTIDLIVAEFRGTKDSSVTYQAVRREDLGNTESGNWYQVNASVPFWADDIEI